MTALIGIWRGSLEARAGTSARRLGDAAKFAFLNVPAHGHTNPTLAVVAELARRGHRIDYWSFEQFRAVIERSGARFRAYPDQPDYEARQAADNLIRLARLLMEVTARVLPALIDALTADRPDVVVHDALAVWGAYVARVLHIPAAASISTFVIDNRVIRRDPALLVYGLGQVAAALPEVLAFERVRRSLRRRFGAPPPRAGEIWSARERLNLVFTSRELQPFGDLFDETYAFVGAALRQEQLSDTDLEGLPRGPLIYVSLGTLFNRRPEFFRAAIEAFAERPEPLVLSVGDSVDSASLGPLGPRVHVRAFVPQLALLRRTTLFVSHGGMNSVNEALYFGVPLVVYPQVHDQLIVARRVAALGAGRTLRAQVSAADLRDAATAVLMDPGYRRRAVELGATLQAGGGADRAADELERLASVATAARERTS